MNKKTKTGLMVALILLCMAACAYVLVRDDTNFQRISALSSLIGLLAMLYYVLNGSRKSEADFFRLTLLCAAAAEFFAQIPHINLPVIDSFSLSSVACIYTVVFGIYMTLGIGRDIGKKLSISLAGIAVLLKTVIATSGLYMLIFLQETFVEQNLLRFFRAFASEGLAVAILLCVCSKYADKARRNTR